MAASLMEKFAIYRWRISAFYFGPLNFRRHGLSQLKLGQRQNEEIGLAPLVLNGTLHLEKLETKPS